MVRMSMVSGPLKVLVALLMLPGLAWAEHPGGYTHHSGAAQRVQRQSEYLDNIWTKYIASMDGTRFGSGLKDNETKAYCTKFIWNTPWNLEESSSDSDSGELSLGDHVGLFGKLASTGLQEYDHPAIYTADGQPVGRTYQVGMSVRANDVLSLLVQWNLYAQGNDSSLPSLDNLVKEPWKDRNALGAGIRFGF